MDVLMAPNGCRRAPSHSVVTIVVVAWILGGAGASWHAAGARQVQTVEQLKAAVILTFARFVEWSPQEFSSASAPIVVGVVADEAVALALETTARGKNVAGRTMAVTRLQWDSEIAGVHMLFVGEEEKRHLGVVLERVRSRQIVTVSSLPGFGRAGGMITLTFIDGRVTFAVNSRATTLSAVRLSSFLLSHATKVSDESNGGGR
jgi:uncharacterized protein DUF4154